MFHYRLQKLLSRHLVLAVACIFLSLVLSLGNIATVTAAEPQPKRPLRVVASFSTLGDMVRNVGGDLVQVNVLVGPNADAHVFEPTPTDARRVAEADLVIVNGLKFEGWLDRLVSASGYRGPVIVATLGVQPRFLNGQADPHAWQSLGNARHYIENIRVALAKSLPAHAALINARAGDYLMRIDALDRDIKKRFAEIPSSQKRVIISHDAFGYYGDAYGVEFFSPQGWSTTSEAAAKQVAGIIQQIKSQRARVLFVENITDPRLMQRISREAGGVMGGTLYSDALSAPGSAADTYLKMFEHNSTTLIQAIVRSNANTGANPSPKAKSTTVPVKRDQINAR